MIKHTQIDLSRRKLLKLSSAIGLASIYPQTFYAVNNQQADEFYKLDAIAQASLINNKEVTAVELTEAAINRIKSLNNKLNAVITPVFEPALDAAKQGLPSGPFSGVPYLLKDLTDFKGYRTAYGSRATINHISDRTHIFAEQALTSGLNVLGKTNTPELGLLGTTEPVAFGPTRNPWDLTRSSGGSSGGSAAAVASGMVAAAQGSDGGGSLRVPSSCCGIFALKVSRGRNVMTRQPVPWELAVRGHITRTVRDSAALYAVTENKSNNAPFATVGLVSNPLKRKLKIALVMKGVNGKSPSADVKAATLATAKLCESLGHDVVEASFPFNGGKLQRAFSAIWSAGASGFKSNIEKQTGKTVGEEILEPWTLYLDKYYKVEGKAHIEEAKQYFNFIENAMDKMMNEFDVILSPVLTTAAPKLGHQGPLVPGEKLMKDAFDYINYTPVYNISGQPAMSVPLNWNDEGLPIGSQFAAKKGKEKMLLELAYQLEEAHSWHQRWAPYSAAYV